MNTADNAQAILAAGAALAKPTHIDGIAPFIALPAGYAAHSLEKMMGQPMRKTGKVETTDAASFSAYLNKHKEPDRTTIYANVDTEASVFRMTAVINDHGSSTNTPAWRDHRCDLYPKTSVEWKRWTGKDGKSVPQADFATWIEDNVAAIATVDGMPTGAQMLQMALAFEATADKRMRSKLNLQNGNVQLEYVEQENEATRTKMEVFSRFTLGIPVFEGSLSAYPIEARLKYRESGGKVAFWFELIRPDRVFKAAVDDELKAIKEATDLPVIYGNP